MEIIIVGAGIAGLGAGVALRQAGHKVTILEQSSLLHEVGAAITIKPNASRVLLSWDFRPEDSAMVAIRRGQFINGTTMDVLVPNYYKDCEEQWGLPMYAVHREDLHSQLRKLATQTTGPGQPCEIRVRSKVVDYDAKNAKVTIENGEILQADLIIAADGVHSSAVKHVLGEDEVVQAGDTGWACMRWLVPRDVLLSDPETAKMVVDSNTRYFTAAGGAAGLVWYPCRNNEIQNFLYLSKEFDTSHIGEDFRAMVDPGMPLEYAKRHFHPALQTVVKKAGSGGDVKFWKLVARGPIPKWHRDRLVLIGDAAHPMLTFQGQGGGQAIEDAAALGILFDKVSADPSADLALIEDRLQRFEAVRRARGSVLQVLSNTSPPVSQEVRDAAAKYLPEGSGIKLESHDDVNDYIFSFDVIAESRKALLESLNGETAPAAVASA